MTATEELMTEHRAIERMLAVLDELERELGLA
jgi:hemerythrin-like domain-containing protein